MACSRLLRPAYVAATGLREQSLAKTSMAFPYIGRGRHSEVFFEQAGEVLWIVEAQTLGCLGDAGSAGKNLLGPLHQETANVGSGRFVGQLANEVAEVVGRQKQLLGAVFHGWQAVLLLKIIVVVLAKQLLEANPNDASSYPAIDPVSTSLSDYQNIIIVTPLWWSQMAAIMQAYLFSAGPEMAGKNIGLIVSSASSGISGVVADCKRLVPDGNYFSENLWINNSNRSRRSTLIKDWLSAINFQEATGIRQMENGELKMENAPVYDLSGRKIVNRKSVNRQFSNLPKGIYIANGRKLLRK